MAPSNEFPGLEPLGLYAADITGDGNCLFNALSDQLYGDQRKHHEIRARVIAYMQEHRDYYKMFIDVLPGGATRRNPKRKTTGANTSYGDLYEPTPQDIDHQFDLHLERMSKGGTYGDNLEINAFAQAYSVDVKIFQHSHAYMVTCDQPTQTAYIAYHTWEHYSSIRNLDGPHTGLPEIKEKVLSAEDLARQQERIKQSSHVQDWMVDIARKSLPYYADEHTIRKALEDAKGNVNDAVAALIEADERGSQSSAQGSSSVERDADSDDDSIYGPNKRRQRHLSRRDPQTQFRQSSKNRVTRNRVSPQARKSSELARSRLGVSNNSSQESLYSTPEFAPDIVLPPPSTTWSQSAEQTEDENWQSATPARESSLAPSNGTSQAEERKGPLRIKINPPKRDERSPIRKSKLKQNGPQASRDGRLKSARSIKADKKLQQKQARKERAQADGRVSSALSKQGLPILTKKPVAPELDTPFRTLYI